MHPPLGSKTGDTRLRRGVGATVEVTASFTDAGGNDTHTCSIDWGDGTVEPGVVANGDCTRSHAHGSVGVLNLTVTVPDDDGGLWITQACSASRFPTRWSLARSRPR